MKATIRSIAKTANVSPATVSRVLSGSTQVTPRMRSHVLNIARKLGYHSAGIRNVALIAGGNFFPATMHCFCRPCMKSSDIETIAPSWSPPPISTPSTTA
ncbi:MAG: LacI family DNA-binding transcriptional regulator [Lentisphaeria bacterium]|nr:MAG: LacI family DNA-binding transcriptional regulator [Lentisphaeria bacterium]